MTWLMCTHCDIIEKSISYFKDCKKKRHEIIKILDERELKPDRTKKTSSPFSNERDKKITTQIYNFVNDNVLKLIVSESDSSQVYGIIPINAHKETINMRSKYAEDWLKIRCFEETNEIYSDEAYKSSLSMLMAKAKWDSKTSHQKIYTRIAMPKKDIIFYDLCNQNREVVKITKEGYNIIQLDENHPALVRRPSHSIQVYPDNENANALDDLVKLFRIVPKDRLLFKVHFISLFLEKYPIPIPVIVGEHGTVKSTLATSIKRIVDPSGDNIGSLPTSVDDLALHLNNRYLSNFDNVTRLSQEQSDMICRAITGEGYTKRQLYTNDEEIIWQYRRKVILNGISPYLDYPDLKDRMIVYETKPLKKDDEEYLTEEDYNYAFESLLPSVLGQIFTTLSKAFSIYDKVKKELKIKNRMADFTIFGECISRILGYDKNEFVNRYNAKQDEELIGLVDAYPIMLYILDLMKDKTKFEDSVSNFHKSFIEWAEERKIDTKSKFVKFPKAPNQVTNQLKNLSPSFRTHDLEVDCRRYTSRDKVYDHGVSVIYIRKLDPNRSQTLLEIPSPSSPLTPLKN